ncbi:MAG: DegT/DnrJ/EryC1/StrS family aminotransferase [Planctomycetaceae bacterium]|nr:DegT/DnrJ/EryC1/StrS family aminotransferase [Planctomycetaceae bacterium]
MIPRRRLGIHLRDVREAMHGLRRGSAPAGNDVKAFEEALGRYLDCPSFIRATASGRDALVLALESVGLRAGDEIVVPAYTLGELISMLQARGYVPVAADIEGDSFNMAIDSVERHIGPRTRAILALHLHGAPCEIAPLCELAARHGLSVVEDCAHALGASVAGQKVGTFGDAAFFSMESNKSVPTYGGGVLVVKDPAKAQAAAETIAARAVRRWPLMKKAMRYWIEEAVVRGPLFGLAARIAFSPALSGLFERRYRRGRDSLRSAVAAYTDFQARLGIQALAALDDRNARLNSMWERLAEALPDELRPQQRGKAGEPAFYNFTAVSEKAAPLELRRRLLRGGVDIGIGSEVMDDCAGMLGASDCPVAAEIFAKACVLPLHEGLNDRRMERMIAVLQRVVD